MSQRGFALLVVLLVMGFLSLLGTQMVAAGRIETRLAGNLRAAAVLEAAADGAVAQAAFALKAARDPSFPIGSVHDLTVGDIPVRVRVEDEADRINLNTASVPLLQAFLLNLGVPSARANDLAAAIADWHTGSDVPRPGGAKAAQYRAAGLNYGPPGVPFRSVGELRAVFGMTPDLFVRMAPHLTVLTDADPGLTTRDPVVARALADTGPAPALQAEAAEFLRITATALGPDGGRVTIQAVVTADFQSGDPRIRILARKKCPTGNPAVTDLCS